MKGRKILAPVVVTLLTVLSWKMLIDNNKAFIDEYNGYIEVARESAGKGIITTAISNYDSALQLQSSPELYVEIIDFYKDQGMSRERLSRCEDFAEEYPLEPKAYDCLLEIYMEDEDYESCYDIIETLEKRQLKSEYADGVLSEIYNYYHLDYSTYSEVGIYSSSFCAVKKKDLWSYVNRYGASKTSSIYTDAGVFTSSGYAPVVDESGDAYFIDSTGNKMLVSDDTYQCFGPISGGFAYAVRPDGKYTYVDAELNPAFGEYDKASSFNAGRALVQNAGRWKIIDDKGNPVGSSDYADVILDGKDIAFRNGRAFVSEGSGFIMIDPDGKRVGTDTYEDAFVFTGEEPTAVKIGGRWCFIDSDGKRVSDKDYDAARPFANGFAAVCENGKWGYIDSSGSMVIPAQFDAAKDFNEKGSCFVKNGDLWQLLKLYRLNRTT